jgi:hypothetical protein
MAKPQKANAPLKPLPENFLPTFSAAMPEWSKQVAQDLSKSADVKGSPGFEPGPEQAQQVEQMAALGMSAREIGAVLRIETKLLEKFYGYEIETSSARINNAVAKIALQMALSGALPEMTKFWLKTRAGWKETKEVQMTGAGGGPIQFSEVKQRLIDQIEGEIIDIEIEEDKDGKA